MKKVVLVLLTVLFVMGLAVASGAAEKKEGDGRHGNMYKHGGEGCGCDHSNSPFGMFKKLGLDEKQRAAIREIHLKTKKAMIMKKADIKVARIELQEILSKDPVDMTAAETTVKKIESLKSEIKMMRIKALEDIKSNLNAEQKKEFSSMMRHVMMKREMMRREMMGHKIKRHGGCGCGMHGKGHMEKNKEEMEHEHHK